MSGVLPNDGTRTTAHVPDPERREPILGEPVSPQAAPGLLAPGFERDATVISQRPVAAVSDFNRSLSLVELARTLEGRQLDHFRVDRMIGGGGMGAVFHGHDLRLDREVAIKVIPESRRDPETLRRFRMEAQSAARLDHPNIARVYDIGEDETWNYIVFEFIEGINLRDLVMSQGPLSIDDAVFFTRQVAEALQHAQDRNVVHRDIKPSNVIITPVGVAKVVDMGLARNTAMDRSTADQTASGVTLGTFDYISPEQARDPRDADVRSDLYSLGCTLFFMLSGRPPFPDGTALQKLLSHGSQPPPDPRQWREDISDQLHAVLEKLMAKRPQDRYQRPFDLINDLLLIAQVEGLQRSRAPSATVVTPVVAQRTFLESHFPWVAAVFVLGASALWLSSVDSLSAPFEIPWPKTQWSTATDSGATLSGNSGSNTSSKDSSGRPTPPFNSSPVFPPAPGGFGPDAIDSLQSNYATFPRDSRSLDDGRPMLGANGRSSENGRFNDDANNTRNEPSASGLVSPPASTREEMVPTIDALATPYTASDPTESESVLGPESRVASRLETGRASSGSESVQDARDQRGSGPLVANAMPDISLSSPGLSGSPAVSGSPVVPAAAPSIVGAANPASSYPGVAGPSASPPSPSNATASSFNLPASSVLGAGTGRYPRSGSGLESSGALANTETILVSSVQPSGLVPGQWADTLAEAFMMAGANPSVRTIEVAESMVVSSRVSVPRSGLTLRGPASKSVELRFQLDPMYGGTESSSLISLGRNDFRCQGLTIAYRHQSAYDPTGLISLEPGGSLDLSGVMVTMSGLSSGPALHCVVIESAVERPINESRRGPRGEADMPIPASSVVVEPASIRIRESIFRGRQNLVRMETASRVELTVEKTFAAVDGRVLGVESSPSEKMPPTVRIMLESSTFITSQGFAFLAASPMGRLPVALHRTSQDCVYWSPAQVPHLMIEGMSSSESLSDVLLLSGKNNAYDQNIESLCQSRSASGAIESFGFQEAPSSWYGERFNEQAVRWMHVVPPERPYEEQSPDDFRLRPGMFLPGYLSPDSRPPE